MLPPFALPTGSPQTETAMHGLRLRANRRPHRADDRDATPQSGEPQIPLLPYEASGGETPDTEALLAALARLSEAPYLLARGVWIDASVEADRLRVRVREQTTDQLVTEVPVAALPARVERLAFGTGILFDRSA